MAAILKAFMVNVSLPLSMEMQAFVVILEPLLASLSMPHLQVKKIVDLHRYLIRP